MLKLLRRWFAANEPPSPPPVEIPDATFLGACGAWTAPDFLEHVPDLEVTGLQLFGPRTLVYAHALSGANLFGREPLPQFVVCGRYTFEADALRALPADPHDAIVLVVRGPEREHREALNRWVDTYEYEALGIDSTPAPSPPWNPPEPGEGFASTGGYFNIPMGLHTPEPGDEPYTLEVWAECGALRSNTLRIAVA